MALTRTEAIQRWKDVANAVFWAEGAISEKWNKRLNAAQCTTSEEKKQLADEYLTAIATEIVNHTTDEQLKEMF